MREGKSTSSCWAFFADLASEDELSSSGAGSGAEGVLKDKGCPAQQPLAAHGQYP